MRFSVSLSLLLFVVSCQFKQSTDGTTHTSHFMQPVKQLTLPARARQTDRQMKIARYRQLDYAVKLQLITYNQFVFLEFSDLTEKEEMLLPNVTSQYESLPSAVSIYDLTNHDYAQKYNKFIGRTISVYASDRMKLQPLIQKLVLVQDPALEKSYVAAKIKQTENNPGSGLFTTSNKRLNPYPFTVIEEPELAQTALAWFDSLTEFHHLKKEMHAPENGVQRTETNVQIYEWRPNDRYVVVQYKFIGDCENLITSYAALYHVTRDSWIQECEGQLFQPVHDLIDIDGDKYPEMLLQDVGASSIVEITNTGFTVKRTVKWSFDFCPC